VKEGSSLCIERRGKIIPDIIKIKVCLVSGNDYSEKYNHKQAGNRGVELELQVAVGSTVIDLRDRAGVELLGLVPGWTKNDTLSPPPAPSASPSLSPPKGTTQARSQGGKTTLQTSKEATLAQKYRLDSEKGLVIDSDPSTLSSSSSTSSINPSIQRRLRRTNFHLEGQDLLEETQSNPKPAKGKTAPIPNQTPNRSPNPNPNPSSNPNANPTSNPNFNSKPSPNSTKPILNTDSKSSSVGDNNGVYPEELITLEMAGLKTGDFLLLEEGPLRLRGQAKLKVYLWVQDTSKILFSNRISGNSNSSSISSSNNLRNRDRIDRNSISNSNSNSNKSNSNSDFIVVKGSKTGPDPAKDVVKTEIKISQEEEQLSRKVTLTLTLTLTETLTLTLTLTLNPFSQINPILTLILTLILILILPLILILIGNPNP
jgi:hypothetical protein